jgi:ribose/xylose/arabinose/galactoside ABC-type transport system permease subunit
VTPKLKILFAQYSPFVTLLIAIVIFSALSPRFATPANLQVILSNSAELGLLVMPLALLVMSGNIDLSVGSVVSMGSITGAAVMVATSSASLGIAAAIIFGACAGAVNGLLISVFGMNPIVVTLGFLSVWGGLALFLTKGVSNADMPDAFLDLLRLKFGPVSIQVFLLLTVTVLSWFLLNKRPLGREILAVGGSKRAAYLIGINVKRIEFLLYVSTGAFAGLVGVMLAGKLASASPSQGLGLEINALLVILIGGVAFEGGSGRISGVVAGLLLIGALNNGLIIIGVSQFLQSMIIGLVMVLAVALERTLRQSVRSAWLQIGEKSTPKEKKESPRSVVASQQHDLSSEA